MLMSWPRIRPLRIIPCLVLGLFLVWACLPYDNPVRLGVRFDALALVSRFRSPARMLRWLGEPGEYTVGMRKDVAVILKTGFGTRDRLPAWLDSVGDLMKRCEIFVIADYRTLPGEHYQLRGQQLPVVDVVGKTVHRGYISPSPSRPRLDKYANLSAAISSNTALAHGLSKSFGWELDAMKFISGFELAYSVLPKKKWFVMVDDDTFVLPASLNRILDHYDPEWPYYLGNVVGDYRNRFAHGGSSVVLSQGALHSLFTLNPEAVRAGNLESVTETYGDRLLSKTLSGIGIYAEESISPLFNGEKPRAAKIRPDRFCLPIVSFHKLTPEEMSEVGKRLGQAMEPISWFGLWGLYGAPPLDQFVSKPAEQDWDFVGRLDEHTKSFSGVTEAEGCHGICRKHDSTCLAWTWESEKQTCHISPWMIVGESAPGKISGPNAPRAIRLANECHK